MSSRPARTVHSSPSVSAPRAALLHLVDESGHGHGAAAAEAPALEPGHRPVADQIADAMRDEAGQARLEAPERMTGEIESERLALAREAHRLAPLRQDHGAPGGGRGGRALLAREAEEVVLSRLMGAAPLVA